MFTEFYKTKPSSQLSTCLMWLATVLSSAYNNPIRAHQQSFSCVFFFHLIHHLEIHAQSGGGVETAHFPLARATNAHLLHQTENTLWWMAVKNASRIEDSIVGRKECEWGAGTHILGNTGALGVEWNARSNGPANLQLPRGLNRQRHVTWIQLVQQLGSDSASTWYLISAMTLVMTLYLDFQDASKGHAEVSIVVFAKHSLEGLLEQGCVEGVSHHNVPPVNTWQQIVYNLNDS